MGGDTPTAEAALLPTGPTAAVGVASGAAFLLKSAAAPERLPPLRVTALCLLDRWAAVAVGTAAGDVCLVPLAGGRGRGDGPTRHSLHAAAVLSLAVTVSGAAPASPQPSRSASPQSDAGTVGATLLLSAGDDGAVLLHAVRPRALATLARYTFTSSPRWLLPWPGAPVFGVAAGREWFVLRLREGRRDRPLDLDPGPAAQRLDAAVSTAAARGMDTVLGLHSGTVISGAVEGGAWAAHTCAGHTASAVRCAAWAPGSHTAPTLGRSVAPLFATGAANGTVLLHGCDPAPRLPKFALPVHGLAFHPSVAALAAVAADGTAKLLRVPDGRLLASLRTAAAVVPRAVRWQPGPTPELTYLKDVRQAAALGSWAPGTERCEPWAVLHPEAPAAGSWSRSCSPWESRRGSSPSASPLQRPSPPLSPRGPAAQRAVYVVGSGLRVPRMAGGDPQRQSPSNNNGAALQGAVPPGYRDRGAPAPIEVPRSPPSLAADVSRETFCTSPVEPHGAVTRTATPDNLSSPDRSAEATPERAPHVEPGPPSWATTAVENEAVLAACGIVRCSAAAVALAPHPPSPAVDLCLSPDAVVAAHRDAQRTVGYWAVKAAPDAHDETAAQLRGLALSGVLKGLLASDARALAAATPTPALALLLAPSAATVAMPLVPVSGGEEWSALGRGATAELRRLPPLPRPATLFAWLLPPACPHPTLAAAAQGTAHYLTRPDVGHAGGPLLWCDSFPLAVLALTPALRAPSPGKPAVLVVLEPAATGSACRALPAVCRRATATHGCPAGTKVRCASHGAGALERFDVGSTLAAFVDGGHLDVLLLAEVPDHHPPASARA